MKFQDLIKDMQMRMNEQGEKLLEDGDAGPATQEALTRFDVFVQMWRRVPDSKVDSPVTPPPINASKLNPAYVEAKKHAGKKETDKTFGAYLSGFWGRIGIPSYKTIIGSTFAWCGLFIFAMNTETGIKTVAGAAAAISWQKYGVAIDWKKDGIPKSAVVQLDAGGDCSDSKNNHVTFADGDCAAIDLVDASGKVKATAIFPGYGGNQGDTVKRSLYKAATICAVRWPAEIAKPLKVTKSVNCTGVASGEETTR